ncbi:MAG: hypothetical protein LBB36_07025, partial [Fibromonadaceae bacterium]|nr:hypothetical protein [Fibromonadaceae bacterium]
MIYKNPFNPLIMLIMVQTMVLTNCSDYERNIEAEQNAAANKSQSSSSVGADNNQPSSSSEETPLSSSVETDNYPSSSSSTDNSSSSVATSSSSTEADGNSSSSDETPSSSSQQQEISSSVASSSSQQQSSSSSAEPPSSSSQQPGSSSSIVTGGIEPCGNTVTGDGTVSCGGKTYKTVKMPDGKIWMAENMNYGVIGSKCYDNLESNCNDKKYGRLYDWATAMNLPSTCNSITCRDQMDTPHRGICPEDWHIPTQAEWNTLSSYVSSDKGCSNCAAKHLRAT